MELSDQDFAVRLYSGLIRKQIVSLSSGKKFNLINLPYYLVGEIYNYLDFFIN